MPATDGKARRLQKEDKLIEAAQVIARATELRVKYGPFEETPDVVLAQLASRARAEVQTQIRIADEIMSYAGQDSRKRDPLYRYEQAEVHLGKAEQLAKAFRQDSQPAADPGSSACARSASRVLAAAAQPAPPANPPSVATLPAPVVPLPAPVVPAAPQPEQPNQKSNFDGSENIGKGFVPLDVKPQPVNHGKELLAQARQYLQAGVTKVARREAEDAYLGNYGVKEEAECVLRDIEAEENSQLALERGRTFDAAVAAYNRGEYAYAGVLLRAIDTRQLDPARQIRYREIMQTVQMQPRPSDHLLPPDSRLVQATQPGTRTTAVPVRARRKRVAGRS